MNSRKRNAVRAGPILLLTLALLFGATFASAQSSENYSLTTSVLDEAGGTASSSNYQLVALTLGQPSPVGKSESDTFGLFGGYIYTLEAGPEKVTRLIAGDGSGTPGSSGNVVEIGLDIQQNVGGLQFDLLFDTNVLTVTDVTPTERTDHLYSFNWSTIDGGIRVSMMGIGTSIAPGIGSIADIIFSVPGDAPEGEYPLILSGQVATDPTGAEIDVELEHGVFTVASGIIVAGDGSGSPGSEDNIVSVDLNNAVAVAALQFDLLFNNGVLTATDVTRTERTEHLDIFGWSPTPGGIKVAITGIGTSIAPGTGSIAHIRFSVAEDAPDGMYDLNLTEVIAADPESYDITLLSVDGVFSVSSCGLRGDPDNNCDINVLDILAVANHILGTRPLTDPCALWRADCNDDGVVNILDALAIANVILGILDECPGGGACKPEANSEVMEFLKSLESFLSADDFARFMALVKAEVPIPTEYSLAQNYPNPFNSTTTIHYTIPSSEHRAKSGGIAVDSELNALHTTLIIYNLLGQEIRTLVNEEKEPGYYIVTWDGKDSLGRELATGVYFCRLTAGTFRVSKRMVLMK